MDATSEKHWTGLVICQCWIDVHCIVTVLRSISRLAESTELLLVQYSSFSEEHCSVNIRLAIQEFTGYGHVVILHGLNVVNLSRGCWMTQL
ncbi:hypothetical protein Ancab_036769 [Ancistrocladus abbreviatus]